MYKNNLIESWLMNKAWLDKMHFHHQLMQQKKTSNLSKLIKKICFCGLIFLLFYPQYLKRLIYPYLLGKSFSESAQISFQDYYKDITAQPINFKRKNIEYTLIPKVFYKITGKVGVVDHYDTLFNIIYRWHSQKDYINLVPRDVFVVTGDMARPEIFEKFEFGHEERGGYVLCKGVKYKMSFMPVFMSEKKAIENMKKFNHCNQFIKDEEQNNYHPIPANEIINKALSMLLPGDIISLEGYLVDVPQMGLYTGTRKGQIHQNIRIGGRETKMCFILYTTKVVINGRIYE